MNDSMCDELALELIERFPGIIKGMTIQQSKDLHAAISSSIRKAVMRERERCAVLARREGLTSIFTEGICKAITADIRAGIIPVCTTIKSG